MTMHTLSNPALRRLSLTGLLAASSLTIASQAQAAAIDFSSPAWTKVGTFAIPSMGQATLETEDSLPNFFVPELENFLGLNPDDLPLNVPPGSILLEHYASQGSAFQTTVNAGDVLSFNFDFSQFSANGISDKDYAFIVFNGVKEDLAILTGSGVFNRTFASAGLFSFGVVDIGDVVGNSTLSITNADLVPIPTPALLPGLVGFAVSVIRRRRQASAE